ncbi:MAG: hypothetical protein HQ579_05575 [Candidatus Omnitrophica bacterium]|nr:hypothetical protein [Candidatus Omnitrophota bacterium]
MKNKKTIIAIILGIGAIISIIYGITSKPTGVHKSPGVSQTSDRHGLSQEERIVPTKRLSQRTRFKSWGRNPFAPGSAGRGGLSLSGIIWSKRSPKAVINSEVVSVGDNIGVYSVKEIKKDCVILSDGTEDCELKME